MVNSMVSMLAYLATDYFATGKTPARTGNDHPIASPYGLFTAKDGSIAVAPATPEILDKFVATRPARPAQAAALRDDRAAARAPA